MIDPVLGRIEACYDAIPRAAGTAEEVGPFTLFRAHLGTGWDFYARPRLGLAVAITPDDVRAVLARQRELGLARALEWVHEVTPSLRAAVAGAAPDAGVEECPLLALTSDVEVAAPAGPGRYVVLTPDHPDLGRVVGAVDAGFTDTDDVAVGDPGLRRELIAAGHLVVVAAYDASGDLAGGGSAAPRAAAAELMGIATIPSARGRGHASGVTRALVAAVRAAGAQTLFLSAGSDAAASIYRRVGFRDVGTALIASVA